MGRKESIQVVGEWGFQQDKGAIYAFDRPPTRRREQKDKKDPESLSSLNKVT